MNVCVYVYRVIFFRLRCPARSVNQSTDRLTDRSTICSVDNVLTTLALLTGGLVFLARAAATGRFVRGVRVCKEEKQRGKSRKIVHGLRDDLRNRLSRIVLQTHLGRGSLSLCRCCSCRNLSTSGRPRGTSLWIPEINSPFTSRNRSPPKTLGKKLSERV